MKRIQLVESTCFFIGTLIIMIVGADFPPPQGFRIIIALFAIGQYVYLGWLLSHLTLKRTLPISIILFALLGSIVTISMMCLSNQPIQDGEIWVIIVALAAGGYGFLVWLISWLILRLSYERQ